MTHVSGEKNGVADFLSRLYWVPENKNKAISEIGPKDGQHIQSPFSPFKVLTKEIVISGFKNDAVTPCADPEFCHLNLKIWVLLLPLIHV